MNQAFKLEIVSRADFTYQETEDMLDEVSLVNVKSKVSNHILSQMRRYDFNIFQFSS